MDKEYIIVLPEFKFGTCGLVNQFLIDNGYSEDFRVVLAEYEWEGSSGHMIKERCMALEPLTDKAEFMLALRGGGPKGLTQELLEYEIKMRGKR